MAVRNIQVSTAMEFSLSSACLHALGCSFPGSTVLDGGTAWGVAMVREVDSTWLSSSVQNKVWSVV